MVAPGGAFMTSWRNGFLLIQGAVPFREVMPLRAGDYRQGICPPLSVSTLISLSASEKGHLQTLASLLAHANVSQDSASGQKNHFFNGRQQEKEGAVFRVVLAELSTGEHLQHIRQGVRKHAGLAATWF